MSSTLYDALFKVLREGAFTREVPAPPSFTSLFSRTSAESPASSTFTSLFSRLPVEPATAYPSIFSTFANSAPTRAPGLSEFILKALTEKPKVFVSYHHGGDRRYYDEFRRIFSDSYDVCHDNSVDREIDSDDSDYVIRRIREQHLTGTSCTIVLCGIQTRWRKFVDWEIKATLDKQHGLVGINLPTNPRDTLGRVHKPDRLQDNIDSGFALWLEWRDLIAGGPTMLRTALQTARTIPRTSVENSRALRKRNG